MSPVSPPAGETPPSSAAPSSSGYRLTGILKDKELIAIVEWGEEGYLVRVGDRIDKEFRVKAITPKSIVLSRGKRGKEELILGLGGGEK
jgi:hypothetical protein